MCSRLSSDAFLQFLQFLRRRHDDLVEDADERGGAEGNRPRSGRAAALLGFA